MKKISKICSNIPTDNIYSVGGFCPGAGSMSRMGWLNAVLCKLSEIFRAVVPVLIALGVIYFVWGVITYVIADSEEAKKKEETQ